MAEAPARGGALARAALAGNPSDAYGGAVLAVTLEQFPAEAVAERADALTVTPASQLVEVTVRRFARELEGAALGTEVRWETSIPLGVGLGGSSAIVIATLRALCGLYGSRLKPARLAALALAIETEELGIAAGLQDRVAQAYEGLTFMDFGPDGRYEQLDPKLLPPLVVAWRTEAAQDSDRVHGSLRTRFERREPAVLSAMSKLGSLATDAQRALRAGDRHGFARAVDGTFEIRRQLVSLDPRHVEMVECARALEANANYTGSGGAIVAVCRDERHRARVLEALGRLGCGTLAVREGASR